MTRGFPTADQARAILEGHDRELVRGHLGVDPETLTVEEYALAVSDAAWREAGLPSAHASKALFVNKEGRFIPGRFAEHLGEHWTFATLEDTGQVLVYDPRRGVYAPAEPRVRGWVQAVMGEEASSHGANEVVGHVQRATYVPRDVFNSPDRLCLLNGVLVTATLEMRPHDPNLRFTVQLPVAFDPEAGCPRFLQFLAEVLPGESHETIQMLFGYCLVPGNWLQRAFMFMGGGNNGKSTLLGVLTALLGPDAVSALTLQSLAANRFATAQLWGKLANVAADIPNAPVRFTGIFKALTGGDSVTGEEKFRAPFTFVNEAKLLFSANELPQVDDRTYAFWRRWVLIPFTQDFTGREDRGLLKLLRVELPGILNWAIEGLRMLRERGDFPEGGPAGDLMEDWKKHSDSLYWFCQEHVEVDPNGQVIKADFYESYRDFCEEHDLTARTQEQVGRELSNHVPQTRSGRPRVDGKRPPCWLGVSLGYGDPDHPDHPDHSRLAGQGGQGGLYLRAVEEVYRREKGYLALSFVARIAQVTEEQARKATEYFLTSGKLLVRDGQHKWIGRGGRE